MMDGPNKTKYLHESSVGYKYIKRRQKSEKEKKQPTPGLPNMRKKSKSN